MGRIKTIAAALLVGALVTAPAIAQGPRAGGPGRAGRLGGPGAGLGIALGSVNLTQAQQDLIKDIRERGRQELQSLQQRLRTAEEARQDAIRTVPLNEGLIRSTTLALADVQADVAVQEARTFNEIFAVLSPEQQTQVRNQQAERQTQRDQRLQKRQPRQQ